MSDLLCSRDKSEDNLPTHDVMKNGEIERSNRVSENVEENESRNKKFLMEHFSIPLTKGLRELILRKPSDPIEFLGQWLLHYRQCKKKAKEMKDFQTELLLHREKLQMLDKERSILWSHLDTSERGEENEYKTYTE